MFIKRLDANEFDVFWGTGWFNWARFSIEGGKLAKVKGNATPYSIVNALKARFGAV